jgi:hypothetical protein
VRYWLGVSKKGDMCVCAICEFMAENETAPALDGKKSIYVALKNSRQTVYVFGIIIVQKICSVTFMHVGKNTSYDYQQFEHHLNRI